MGDITSEQFDAYVEQMQKSVGLLDKLARKNAGKTMSYGGSGSPTRQYEQDLKTEGALRKRAGRDAVADMRGYVRGFGDTVRLLDSSSKNLGDAFKDLSKKIVGGAVIAEVFDHLVSWGEHWVSNYREMANVGQSFNGSLRDMATAATSAGMPLTDFANFVKKNSKVMAAFGQKDVAALAKGVRKSTTQFGMYGYSIEQMNDLTSDYLDMQRVMGNRLAATQSGADSAVKLLATNANSLAATFGESRDEILKRTKETMESPNMLLAARMYPGLAGNKAVQGATTAFSAVPGQGGSLLTNLFTSALQGRDFMYQTDEFQQLLKMGASGVRLANLVADAAEKAKKNPNANGLAIGGEAITGIQGVLGSSAWAAAIQNITDKSVGQTYAAITNSLTGYDASPQAMSAREAQQQQMDKTSAAVLGFDQSLMQIKATIYDKLLKSITPQMWDAFGNGLNGLVTKLSAWAESIDPKKISAYMTEIGNDVAALARLLGKLHAFFVTITGWLPGAGKEKDGSPNVASMLYGAGGMLLTGMLLKKITGGLLNKTGGMIWDKVTGRNKPAFKIGEGAAGEAGGVAEGAEGALAGAAEGGLARSLMRGGGKLALIGLALAGAYKLLGGGGGGGAGAASSSTLPGDPTALLQLEVTEQRRTNELLEAILKAGGFTVPGLGGSGGGGGGSAIGTAAGLGALGFTGYKVAKNLRGGGGLTGLLEGGLEGAGRGLLHGGLIGAGLESLDYLTGQRKLNWRNLAKSGLRVAGGAGGALLGSGLASVATGYAGYKLGDWAGDLIFGSDDEANGVAPAKATAPRQMRRAPPRPEGSADPVAQLLDLNTRQLNNLRRHTQLLEERLPPIIVPTKSLEVQSAMLLEMTKLLNMQEAVVDKLERNLRNQVVISDHLREIRDHARYTKN